MAYAVFLGDGHDEYVWFGFGGVCVCRVVCAGVKRGRLSVAGVSEIQKMSKARQLERAKRAWR